MNDTPRLSLDNQAIPEPRANVSLDKTEAEKTRYRQALKQTGGNRTQAAELLGVSRRTLQRKLLLWGNLLEFWPQFIKLELRNEVLLLLFAAELGSAFVFLKLEKYWICGIFKIFVVDRF